MPQAYYHPYPILTYHPHTGAIPILQPPVATTQSSTATPTSSAQVSAPSQFTPNGQAGNGATGNNQSIGNVSPQNSQVTNGQAQTSVASPQQNGAAQVQTQGTEQAVQNTGVTAVQNVQTVQNVQYNPAQQFNTNLFHKNQAQAQAAAQAQQAAQQQATYAYTDPNVNAGANFSAGQVAPASIKNASAVYTPNGQPTGQEFVKNSMFHSEKGQMDGNGNSSDMRGHYWILIRFLVKKKEKDTTDREINREILGSPSLKTKQLVRKISFRTNQSY